jgi:thioredoxin reductase (NADPH)
MAKPVIWTVDDDPDVLRAVKRNLRRQYGNRYRVMAADSGANALESLKQLKLRNDPVALFLVDQRMPAMSGVEFLEAALEFYPDAKRALLTAYADNLVTYVCRPLSVATNGAALRVDGGVVQSCF